MALSPVAEVTRVTGRGRTFPAANTLGMPVPAGGGRSGGRPAGGWPAGTGRGRRPGNLASPAPGGYPHFHSPAYPHV
jgi:hypothetical protein